MAKPAVILVGADKGGVGKTTVSRALLDYFIAHNIPTRAFDTESPKGTLRRFHPDVTEVVDMHSTADQMKIFDTLSNTDAQVTVIDIRAGLLSTTLRSLRDQVGSELTKSVIGGHSYGGRVASMVAAETEPAGLVLLSYPLHRPGHPEKLRADHWTNITCPVLLLSGDRDQFARTDLLQACVERLPRAELHIYPGMGHGLQRAAGDVAERIAIFARGLDA